MLQASAYMTSYISSTLLLFVIFLRDSTKSSKWLINLQLVLFQLQGVHNCIIFIAHKIYNFRRQHQDFSWIRSLAMLFSGSIIEPIMFTRMSMIQEDRQEALNNYLGNVGGMSSDASDDLITPVDSKSGLGNNYVGSFDGYIK